MDEMTNSPWKLQEFPHGEFSLRLVEVVKKPKHNQGFHWATLSIAFWSTDTWTRREYKRMCFEMGYSVNINWMFCKICRFGAKINKNEGYGTQWPMQMNGEFIIAILPYADHCHAVHQEEHHNIKEPTPTMASLELSKLLPLRWRKAWRTGGTHLIWALCPPYGVPWASAVPQVDCPTERFRHK